MIRKLILTTVCGLLVCASQGNCDSRRGREYTPEETAFVDPVKKARAGLSNMIRGKSELQPVALNAAIDKAGECVRLCNEKMTEDKPKARLCGIPQTHGQALFLKEVLESISKVQTEKSLTLVEKQQIEKLFSDAIRCYKGEIGLLVETAQTRLAQILAQATAREVRPSVKTGQQRSAKKSTQSAKTLAQQKSTRKRSQADPREVKPLDKTAPRRSARKRSSTDQKDMLGHRLLRKRKHS